MRYESQRIIHKQQKYVKTRAYNVINDLERKGFNSTESIDIIKKMRSDDCNETEQDILDYARKVLELKKENTDGKVHH
jgi:hypothetical protein